MRRTQFIVAIIVALLTFFSLQTFVGYRHGRPFGWYRGYGYGPYHYYLDCRTPYNWPGNRYEQRQMPERRYNDSVFVQPQ